MSDQTATPKAEEVKKEKQEKQEKKVRIKGADQALWALNRTLNSLWDGLGAFRQGRDLRYDTVKARKSIGNSDDNDAVKKDAYWAAVNSYIIKAGQLGYDRMVKVAGDWSGKPREWNGLYAGKFAELEAKYQKLWAANADGEIKITDGTLRMAMQSHAKAMLAFTADDDIWAPYGRCAKEGCGRRIMPDRHGRLHPKCGRCYHQERVAKEEATNDWKSDAIAAGVTVSVEEQPKHTSAAKSEVTDEEKHQRQRKRSRRNNQEPPEVPPAGGRPEEYMKE